MAACPAISASPSKLRFKPAPRRGSPYSSCHGRASEGVSLQNYCSKLIHFEIPWNPNRMEQRNGRVDRRPADEVQIFHFVGQGFGSAEMARQGR